MNYLQELESAAKKRGAAIVERSPGHFQIKGSLLVNYYPESKQRSAYVAGTVKGRKYVSPKEAVAMAFTPPPVADIRDSRSKGSRAKRQKIGIRLGWFCFWCQAPLSVDTSTLEHKIPLARGGLDNANNRVLACLKCNGGRGHDMPELSPVGKTSVTSNEGKS